MKKLKFKIEIKAPKENVYRSMLGLDNKSDYEGWTKVFNPTSTFKGSWQQGERIYFIGSDENGKQGGMVSEIAENTPNSFVSIRHLGVLDGDNEITSGPEVEKWAGGLENYDFSEENGVTTVTVELDSVEDYVDYFNKTYPKALEELKRLIES